MLAEAQKTILDGKVKGRAVLYARFSADDRKSATSSIERQLRDARAYADKRGYSVVGEFFEEPNKTTSGADWLPEIKRVLELAEKSAFDVLIVKMDRIARNKIKWVAIETTLQDFGQRIEYIDITNAKTPEGGLQRNILADFAEYERLKFAERSTRGRIDSAKAGNVPAAHAPYGYKRVKLDSGRYRLEIASQHPRL